jgi:hypothetical protein
MRILFFFFKLDFTKKVFHCLVGISTKATLSAKKANNTMLLGGLQFQSDKYLFQNLVLGKLKCFRAFSVLGIPVFDCHYLTLLQSSICA